MNGKKEKKASVLMRLRRIEGQIRGLQRMVETEASCSDILVQVAAVTAAVKKAGMVIAQCYLEDCLGGVLQKSGEATRGKVSDFQKAISRYIDLA